MVSGCKRHRQYMKDPQDTVHSCYGSRLHDLPAMQGLGISAAGASHNLTQAPLYPVLGMARS